MAYRDVDLVKKCLAGSVKIVHHLKPIINCKVINISSKNNYGINKLLKMIFTKLNEKNIFENAYISG